jgi:hypothetical protein
MLFNNYMNQLTSALTTIRHVNKTDVATLGSTFGVRLVFLWIGNLCLSSYLTHTRDSVFNGYYGSIHGGFSSLSRNWRKEGMNVNFLNATLSQL